ncbi:hypothetical protein SteCoe_15631 [Stentor coeruleus]|uniref:Uncharacterized protein n=1 Tax=Stentor coeruleus TaxID=5963 RepID=A0A1R2C373_9CILI|nr:hypothetical protein SteCoe_15631 [Stentor coeruleus]
MHHFRRGYENDKSPNRSTTPLSGCSSNFDTMLNDSSGLRSNFGGFGMPRTNDDEFFRPEKQQDVMKVNMESMVLMLQSLESDMKRVDFNFEFKKIDQDISTVFSCIREAASFLSLKACSSRRTTQPSQERRNSNVNDMCVSCLKMKSLMDEATFSIEREKESLENTEKHLKHYDSLLAIKENRLREQELSFENEKNMLEIQKNEICREKVQIDKQKEMLTSAHSNIKTEKEALEKQVLQIEKKYQDVRKILSDYENQKSNVENTIKNDMNKSFENRENALKNKESEINRQYEELKNKARQFEKSYLEKTGLFEKLKNDVISKQKIIQEKKSKIAGLKRALEEAKTSKPQKSQVSEQLLQEITDKEENIRLKSLDLELMSAKITEERTRLEILRRSLQDEKESIDQEIYSAERACREKMHQATLLEERAKERIQQTELKEQKLEEMIKALQEEEDKLEERWKSVESIQSTSYELAQLKDKYLNLQKSFAEQQMELNDSKYKYSDVPLQLSSELREKMLYLEKKEEDLNEWELQMKKEREEIDMSASLIKQLNEDLEKQKLAQIKEQKRLQELARDIKSKEQEHSHLDIPRMDRSESAKNSSNNSLQRILVSDMSPFDEKDIFHTLSPKSQ